MKLDFHTKSGSLASSSSFSSSSSSSSTASSAGPTQAYHKAPQRRYSLVQPLHELFRKSIGEVVSRVDWVQVNHYMDKLA